VTGERDDGRRDDDDVERKEPDPGEPWAKFSTGRDPDDDADD
jgi:hypothetical protein